MKTTKKHFDIFKTECERWIDQLKLDNWKIYYVHRQVNPNTYATCSTKAGAYVATLFFTDNWDTLDGNHLLIEEHIKDSAKHEVIHLLLARLSDCATSRNYMISDCLEAEEELVRKLENIIK